MLRFDCESESLIEQLQRLECRVAIPQDLLDEMTRRESSHGVYDDRRQFQRRKCAMEQAIAGMQPLSNLPALKRAESWERVYIADISRGGVGFLHSGPLYPLEQLCMLFPTGLQRTLEVVRCRRLATHCFSVGARFAATSDNDAEDARH